MSASATIHDQAERHVAARNEPALEVTWRTLRTGDRIEHFEYGAGTVDGSGPWYIYVTWDDPEHERLTWHTASIARYLRRVP